ncbi:MAG TPA: hypothetical protein VK013_01570, partial [Myxococcaceae bacterium]|nr:hypothetical protein [Myxococcaceae bacterium]
PKPPVVVIEPDEDLRASLCTLLSFEGFLPLPAGDAATGWKQLCGPGPAPHAVLLAAELAHGGAEEFLARWRTMGPEWVPVILLAQSRAQARQRGLRDATTTLLRPIRSEALLSRLRNVLGRHRAKPRPSAPRTLDLPLAGPPPSAAR